MADRPAVAEPSAKRRGGDKTKDDASDDDDDMVCFDAYMLLLCKMLQISWEQ